MDEGVKKHWREESSRPEFYGEPADRALTMMRPRVYGDTPSFLEVAVAWEPKDLEGADAVFLGIPWEADKFLSPSSWTSFSPAEPDPRAIVGRGGAHQAPEWIRKWSMQHSLQLAGGYCPEVAPDFRLSDHLKIADYRDVEFRASDVEDMSHQAIARVSEIVRAGAVPLVFGGDHAITYPVVKGISDSTEGKIGIVHFDSHYDLEWGARLNAGNQFARILDTCRVEPENMAMIGIRGTGIFNSPRMHEIARKTGISVFTLGDVEKLGMEEVIRRSIEITMRGTDRVYITLDVDVIEPASFPAQKYPDPFGLTARQVRDGLRTLSTETPIAGFDMCCIGPAYDHMGLGLMTACRLYHEVLKGMAVRKARRTR
ncbi:MAG: agmatinase family protein [Acidobacteriota bacterium]